MHGVSICGTVRFFSGNKSLEKSYLIAFLMSVRVVFEEKKILVAVVAITLLQLYSSNILSSQEIPRKRDGVCSKN